MFYYFVYKELAERDRDYPSGFRQIGALGTQLKDTHVATQGARYWLRLRDNEPIGVIFSQGPVQIKQCQDAIAKQRSADLDWREWTLHHLPQSN